MKYEKIPEFLSEKIQFLEVKFSIYVFEKVCFRNGQHRTSYREERKQNKDESQQKYRLRKVNSKTAGLTPSG